MPTKFTTSGYLAGKMLVATPSLRDPRFARTVVYVCAHTPEGAMGLVVNRLFDAITFPDLLEQLGIEPTPGCGTIRVHFGGPVETGRGFVLHTPDWMQDTTLVVDGRIALTATVDVLKAIAEGEGPERSLLALGYAGWSPGQLDAELLDNSWLVSLPDDELLFGDDLESKWALAMRKMGIDFSSLSGAVGHA